MYGVDSENKLPLTKDKTPSYMHQKAVCITVSLPLYPVYKSQDSFILGLVQFIVRILLI